MTDRPVGGHQYSKSHRDVGWEDASLMDQYAIDRRLLLGGKALVQTTPQITAGQPSASKSTAATSANVRDFGARGNGRADDTEAIQAAVNWGSRKDRGDIYFPVGTYKIVSPIRFGRHRNVSISFIGDPGAIIVGDFRGFLLKGVTIDRKSGSHSVENLRLINKHLRGGGVVFRDCAGGKVSNCQIRAWQGIAIEKSHSLLVDTCTIIALENSRSSVGILAESNTSVLCTNVAGYQIGLKHHGVGLTVLGGYFEDNKIGLRLGRSEGFHIAGLIMEANRVGIDIRQGTGGAICGVSIGGDVRMIHGVRLESCEAISIQAVTVEGEKGYTEAGISVEDSKRIVVVGASSTSSRRWLVRRPRQLDFIQSNYQ